MKIKKWQRVTHEGMGISLEIGRLSYSQKPQLAVMAADVLGPLLAVGGGGGDEAGFTLAQKSAALREAFSKLDAELIGDVFEHKVRDVQGVETEDGPVTTGKELLELADQTILMWVLTSLVNANQLSDQEGKASGSPSTSNTEATPSSISPAANTVPGDGATPSTVMETPAADRSSTPAA